MIQQEKELTIRDILPELFEGVDHRLQMHSIKDAFVRYVENGEKGNICVYSLDALKAAKVFHADAFKGQRFYLALEQRIDDLEKERARDIAEKSVTKARINTVIWSAIFYFVGLFSPVLVEALKRIMLP